MFRGDSAVTPSDPQLHQLMEDFEREVLKQSQSLITEDLRRTLPYHFDPEKTDAVGPSELRVERVLEGVYVCDSDDDSVMAPEMVEALKQPPLC